MSLQVQKRIQDSSAIETVRTKHCEYSDPETGERCKNPVFGGPHHIKSRGAGGDDIRENLISLCAECHQKAHGGNISRQTLVQIVADREALPYDDVCKIIRLYPKSVEPETSRQEVGPTGATVQATISPKPQEPILEDMISAYIQIDEQEKNARWIKGQLLHSMLEAGVQQGWLASQVGVSSAQIRELVKVYKAFPDEGMRIPSLSWYHHRVAANSADPVKNVQLAADQEMSTRQLRKTILETEGRSDLVQQEQAAEQKTAERIFKTVETFLGKGGDAAEWLRSQLVDSIGKGGETHN